MANWYLSSVAYTAVAQWAATTAYTVGQIIRQLASPSVGSERCFRCTTLGTSGSTEPTWTLTTSGTTVSGTATFTECTGQESFQTTSWAAPLARLATATGKMALSDTCYVSHDHAETQATAMNISAVGGASSGQYSMFIICVHRPTTSIPPAPGDLATGGTMTTTGANALTISSAGQYWNGVGFSCGSGAVGAQTLTVGGSSAPGWFENCTFSVPSTSGASIISCSGTNGVSGCVYNYKNCTFNFGAIGAYILTGQPTLFNGGSITGTPPTVLFNNVFTGAGFPQEIRNMDLSLLAASSHLVNLTDSALPALTFTFHNCKLNALLAGVTTNSIGVFANGAVDVTISDSSGATVRSEHYRFEGTITTDTTNYLTAGASNGSIHYSNKYVSLSGCAYTHPLFGPETIMWLATGSHVLTMYFANTSSVTYKDNQVGFEVEFMGDASGSDGTNATSFSNIISSGTALATNAVAWTGLSSPVKQQASATITVNQACYARVRPMLRAASATVWIDPFITNT